MPVNEVEALRRFWQCWQGEAFFEAHEVLEDAWRVASGPRKLLLHGLIHGAVARYQHRRGNAFGAARQYTRACVRLETLSLGEATRLTLEVGRAGFTIEAFLEEVERDIAPSLRSLSEEQRLSLQHVAADVRQRMSDKRTSGESVNDKRVNGKTSE
jgi:hypothetical protein